MNDEMRIDQEVRVRLLEENIKEMKEMRKEMKADKLQVLNKIDSNFHWVLGTIIAQIAVTITLFGGVILHLAKLI